MILFEYPTYFIAIILNLFLGIFIFLKDKRSEINRNFFLATIFVEIWLISLLLFYTTKSEGAILLIGRINFATILPLIYFSFKFIFPFPNKIFLLPKRWEGVLFIWVILFTLIATFTPLVDKNEIVTGSGAGGRETIFGPLFSLYTANYILGVIGIFGILLYKLRKTKEKIEKIQIQYVLIGLITALVFGFITNIFFYSAGITNLANFGPLAPIIFSGFVFFAIFRYHLFEIRVVLTTLLVIVIALVLLSQIFFAQNLQLAIINSIVFAVFLFFGFLLIRSVFREIKLREELQAAYIKLEKLDKAKSEFISIASHQLRTPLTAIKGYISMMLEGSYGKVSGKLRGKLQNVAESNERLIRLINDLLSVSRIESGKLEINKERTPLERIIKSVFDTLTVEAKRKSIELIWKKPAIPLPDLLLDPDKIRDVILNLIDNAIKYTEKGHIEVSAAQTGAVVHIEIADTGAGMTQEEIDELFKSFSRGTAGKQNFTEGAGLGLYIAKKFVDMHDGRIWVESAGKGMGSTFHIDLPISSSIETETFIKNF